MSNEIIKELLYIYSNLPLGVLIFKNKELFFINDSLRETLTLGAVDNKSSMEIICSTLGIESSQKQLYTYLSDKDFFTHKKKVIQINSKNLDDYDIFVFTLICDSIIKKNEESEEIDFSHISLPDINIDPEKIKEHLKLLNFFDKKRNKKINTHTLYKGMPLIANNKILQAYNNTLALKIEDKQMIVAIVGEQWILKISSKLIVKGEILKVDKIKRYIFLKNLHQVQKNYHLRKTIRYLPQESGSVTLNFYSKKITLKLIDISENTFKISTNKQSILNKIQNYNKEISSLIILDEKQIKVKSTYLFKTEPKDGESDIIMKFHADSKNLKILKEWANKRQLEIIREVHKFSKMLYI